MLDDTIYTVITADGEIFSIARNNQYSSHYQYLQDFSKQNSYLKRHSFGLIFDRDDNIPQLWFIRNLVLDSTIVYENHKILSSETISSIQFYLPIQISEKQKEILEIYMPEIDSKKSVFLETYHEEADDFYPIYKKPEDFKNGGILLRKYIEEHLVIREKTL